jgi:hypothetical protein
VPAGKACNNRGAGDVSQGGELLTAWLVVSFCGLNGHQKSKVASQ